MLILHSIIYDDPPQIKIQIYVHMWIQIILLLITSSATFMI